MVKQVPRQFKDERELEAFVNEEINKPIPLGMPQWQIWFQQDFQGNSIVIQKQHHCLCDGISLVSFHIGQGDKYDISALM